MNKSLPSSRPESPSASSAAAPATIPERRFSGDGYLLGPLCRIIEIEALKGHGGQGLCNAVTINERNVDPFTWIDKGSDVGKGRYLRVAFCLGGDYTAPMMVLVDDWRSKTDEEIIAEVETEIAIQLIRGGA